MRATISRTGYTGEDGFEVFVPPASAERVWDAILQRRPAGRRRARRPRRARHAAARSGDAALRQRHGRDDDRARSGPRLDRRLEEGGLHRRRRAAPAEAGGRQRASWSASKCSTARIARHGHDVYVDGAEGRRRHERHADAVPEEGDRHGVSARRIGRRRGTEFEIDVPRPPRCARRSCRCRFTSADRKSRSASGELRRVDERSTSAFRS